MKTCKIEKATKSFFYCNFAYMARRNKQIMEHGIDKRDVGYYSTPDFMAQYIYEEMVKLNPAGSSVLDPAVGRGELLKSFIDSGKIVHGYDIIDYPNRLNGFIFHHEDFLARYISHKENLRRQAYDYIIMNPPYNSHEHTYIATNKILLQSYFKTGATNMYALFMQAVIEIAKEGCIIGTIVPQSILFTRAYDKLRDKLLQLCDICQIILCPTNLFRHNGANVDTCILILRKGKNNGNLIRIANRSANIATFKSLLKQHNLIVCSLADIYQRINNKSAIFVLDCPPDLIKIFTNYPRLDEIFMCGGGVSTGNNKLFTSFEKREGFEVPYYPNVNARFLATPESFLCNDYMEQYRGTRKFIVRHPDKLECDGIVCSGIGKSFRAAYLSKEGVTGVNAAIWAPKEDVLWLISYLNSSLVAYLLKGIIARSHITTIGNVSSLPILNLTDCEKKTLGRISKQVINGKLAPEDAIAKIDRIVYRNINLSRGTRKMIRQFCADIIHLV